MKNPYVIPVVGIIILAFLMMFQRQQAKMARELRAAADEAARLIPERIDSLKGEPAGRKVLCDGFPYGGVAYPIVNNPVKGRIEFELAEVSGDTGMVLLFALHQEDLQPCMLTLESMLSALSLAYKPAERNLVLVMNGKSASMALPAKMALPLRLACEWEKASARLSSDGVGLGRVEGAGGFAPGRMALFLGHHPAPGGRGPRVKMADLTLHLIRKN
jgi:hypothetical protein